LLTLVLVGWKEGILNLDRNIDPHHTLARVQLIGVLACERISFGTRLFVGDAGS
jgi:hypothetical protein